MFFCCVFCSSWYTRVYEYTIHLCVPNTFVYVCVCLTQALRQKRYKNKFNILRFVCVRCACVCYAIHSPLDILKSGYLFGFLHLYVICWCHHQNRREQQQQQNKVCKIYGNLCWFGFFIHNRFVYVFVFVLSL